MNQNFHESKKSMLEFTARFGFVTRDLFFEYFCPLQKSSKYAMWARIQREGLVIASRGHADVFYLTKRARNQMKAKCCPSRSIYFIEHDLLVARILLDLRRSGLVINYWTERDLRSSATLAVSVLGTEGLAKYPDLVLSMKSSFGAATIAFEVERTRKSDSRYNHIAIAYTNAIKVGLIIYACDSSSTRRAIEQAFDGEFFVKAAKVPATLLIGDFERLGFEAEAKFMNRRMSLKKLTLAALSRTESDWKTNVEKARKDFQVFSKESKAAS